MKKILISFIVICLSVVSCVAQNSVKFTFDNFKVDNKSAWSSHITGEGNPCKWRVINDNNNFVLAQVSSEKEDYRFNIIVNDSLEIKDVEIKLRFKGVKGRGDQGGGPVWRYQDENNYYVARANPLENNFRVYKVINGRRMEIGSAKIEINSNQWYNIKIEMQGDLIKCYFNNVLEMEVKDNSIHNKGKVGLWTKSDAVTYFDDFEVLQL